MDDEQWESPVLVGKGWGLGGEEAIVRNKNQHFFAGSRCLYHHVHPLQQRKQRELLLQ